MSPRPRLEILIVLGLSLGQSAVYAVVNLIDITSRMPVADAQAQLNTSVSDRPYLDLTYQLLGIGFALVPVVLALYLMSLDRGVRGGPAARIGFDLARPGRDFALGLALFAGIGLGTLGLYAAGRAAGITATISTNNLGEFWWTVPVLILAALKNGVLEEVLVVGYLFDRLRRLRWGWPAIIVASAVLRGSYHLYQGFGPFLGNVVMGIVFGLLYLKHRRVMPLVIAHTALDVVGFLAPGILEMVDPTAP